MNLRPLPYLLLAAVVAAPGVVAARSIPGTDFTSSPSGWQDKLDTAFERLRAGDAPAARRALERLERHLREDLSPSRKAASTVARLSLGRALLAAVEERGDDAIWHLDVALALDSTLAGEELARHGPAGARLTALAAARAADPVRPVAGHEPGFRPARELARRRPSLADRDHPVLGGRYGDLGPTVVEYVVDAEGRARSPRIVAAPDLPTLTLAVLDRLREARFEPASLDGRRVASLRRLELGPVRSAPRDPGRETRSSGVAN